MNTSSLKCLTKYILSFIKYMEYSFMRKVNSLINLNEILIYLLLLFANPSS